MSRANPRFHRTNPTLPALTGNVVMLTLFGTVENQLTLNILYYEDQTGTVGSITNLNSFIGSWTVPNQASLLAVSSSDWSLTQYKAQYVNLPAIIPQYSTTGLPQPGTGPATHEPTTVAALISKFSQVKGQSGRGRYYIPAIPTAWVTASSINPTFITNYNTYAGKLVNQITSGGITYTPGIFSRRGFNKVTGTGGGFSPMSNAIAKTLLGTVRRRRIGRGK